MTEEKIELVECGKCKRTVPDHLICMNRPASRTDNLWWPEEFKDAKYLCLICVDHRICYPFFELAIAGSDAGLSIGPDGQPLRFDNQQVEEWKQITLAAHACCYADRLIELQTYLRGQK